MAFPLGTGMRYGNKKNAQFSERVRANRIGFAPMAFPKKSEWAMDKKTLSFLSVLLVNRIGFEPMAFPISNRDALWQKKNTPVLECFTVIRIGFEPMALILEG